jgi:phosphate transport system permease protein
MVILKGQIFMKSFQTTKRRNEIKEKVVKWLLFSATAVSILTTFAILFSIVFEAIEFFKLQSFWYFITGTEWSPGVDGAKFGAVGIFAGTFMITFIAMAVALPIGVLSAVYLSEYAGYGVRNTFKPMLEILAGIPTVVYGFFAALTVAPLIVNIAESLGVSAAFNSALASGIVMGIMIIPIISSLSDDVIKSVPDSMRNGSLALGMTKTETIIHIVLPAASPGIISASLLGISRALGETMIVVMAAGLRPNLTWNPLEDMTTVTVSIVNALTGDFAFGTAETLSAFALGLVLFVVTLFLNLISVFMIKKFKEKYKSNNL